MMTSKWTLGFCLTWIVLAGCSGDLVCEAGKEDCRCRADNVCDKGLTCKHDESLDRDRCVADEGTGGAGGGDGAGGGSGGAVDDPTGGAGGSDEGDGGESSSGGAPGSGGAQASGGEAASGGESSGGQQNDGGESPGSGGQSSGGAAHDSGGAQNGSGGAEHGSGGVGPGSGGAAATGGAGSSEETAGPFTERCRSCAVEVCGAEARACNASEVCFSCLSRANCPATGAFGAYAECLCNYTPCTEYCGGSCR